MSINTILLILMAVPGIGFVIADIRSPARALFFRIQSGGGD